MAALEQPRGSSSSSKLREPRADTRDILDTAATALRRVPQEWALLLACPSPVVLVFRPLLDLILMASMLLFSSMQEALHLRHRPRGMLRLLLRAITHPLRRPAISLLHHRLPATKFCSLTTLTC